MKNKGNAIIYILFDALPLFFISLLFWFILLL